MFLIGTNGLEADSNTESRDVWQYWEMCFTVIMIPGNPHVYNQQNGVKVIYLWNRTILH